ncbi:hypothetical protein [Spirosoma lituiforme]
MAFFKFKIESYKVTSYQYSTWDFTNEIKVLSEVMPFGARYSAQLIFEKDNSYQSDNRLGYVKLPPASKPGSITEIVVECNKENFPGFYQILSTEKPVYLFIAYEDKLATKPANSHFIFQMQLSTDTELPGDFEK